MSFDEKLEQDLWQLKKFEGREGNKSTPLGKETFDEKAEETELKMPSTAKDIAQGEAPGRITEKKEIKKH